MRSVLGLILFTCVAVALEPLKPGLEVGQRPGPYSFLVATGPQRGQQTCYICEQENKPTAVVFARTLTPQLGQLLLQLDEVSTQQKDTGFKAWMTQLTDTADLDTLGKWSQRQGLKAVVVGAFEDDDGPPAYKIPAAAEVVLILAKDRKVQASFAWRGSELTEAARAKALQAVQSLFRK